MGFMQSYKRLDNLCRDMNGLGVTGYILDMEEIKNAGFYVSGWEEDYRRLKRYRHIRNQIAHENGADEENMCSAGDAQWIEDFYQSILEQADPLAVYYRKYREQRENTSSENRNWDKSEKNSKKLFAVLFLLSVLIMVLVLFLLFFSV